jgi:hypothetical protein
MALPHKKALYVSIRFLRRKELVKKVSKGIVGAL